MLRLIKVLLVLSLLVVLLVAGVFISALDPTPLVVATSAKQVDEAESVKALLSQLSQSVKNRTRDQRFTVSEMQLNSLVGFAQRAHGKFHGRANISPRSSLLAMSYQLPDNPFGKYINLSVRVLPGDGLQVSQIKLGRFNLPGELTLSSIVWLADWWTKSDIASQFVRQVDQVAMFDANMVITVRPLDAFFKELNQLQLGLSGSGDEVQRAKTAHYLKFISQLPEGSSPYSVSLAKYVGLVFKEAQGLSDGETAAKENEAAILALAIYAGHHRFANFVGSVQPIPGVVVLPRKRPVLANRTDLNQHFIFSAAIKILSEQGISTAIGEFKELMDRGEGGSGYSFVDLAADFAGIAFAQRASDPRYARQLQYVLANNPMESAFFPDIAGLPEGLSKAAFSQYFGQVDSLAYKQLVTQINQSIRQLPIHL
ncbi:MAG: hypothetical protein ACI965_002028 [Paraglaciecola sp.]